LFIAPCSAFLSSKGVIDSRKAKQLVNSVFSEENKTELKDVEKRRLNGTDEIVFLKQYHNEDNQEVSNAGIEAEKYSEVSFEALSEMLKAAGPRKAVPAVVHAAVQASKPRQHRLHPRLHVTKQPESQTSADAPSSNSPKTFIDLGSGVGRAVLFACATGEFETCEGVELSESRHKLALDALSKFKHLAPGTAKKVTFINGNLLDNDAYFKKDVMLLDNDYLSEGLIENFVRKFEHVAPTGTVLLTTKKVPQLAARVATRTRMAVEGEKGHRELFFKYTRT
jgi:hypothetical protein